MSDKINSQTVEDTMSHQALKNLYPDELLEPNKGINIKEFWSVVTSNKKLLMIITLAGLILSLLITFLMTPIYRATTTIQIARQATAAADILIEQTAQRRNERDYWQTQVQLLQSRTLAVSVMKKLGIRDHFQSKPGLLSFIRSAPPTPEDIFLKGLSITPLNTSQLLSINYESQNAELSQRIVNALAEEYITSQLKREFDNTQQTKDFLQKQMDNGRERLSSSENALNKFAQENNIIVLDNNETTSTHLMKSLQDELVKVERKRIELENETHRLTLAAKSPDPSMMLDTPKIIALKDKLTLLEDSYRDLEHRKLHKRRAGRNLTKKIELARGKIRREAKRYQVTLSSKLKAAQGNEISINKHLKNLQEKSLVNQKSIQIFEGLKREVHANQSIYQGLVERMEKIGISSDLNTNNVTIVDRALIPTNKFKPKVKTNVMFGTVVGFLLGIGLIFLREFVDDSFKKAEDVERFTNLPLLGLIPLQKGATRTRIAQQIIKEPRSPLSESIRSLRTTLRFSTKNGSPKTLFFTSAVASEGKTSIAINLAAAYVNSGKKVLLIDADLRKPSIHAIFGMNNKVGLSNYLSGNSDAMDITQHSAILGLHVIAAGPIPPDPVDLLSGDRTKALIESAEHSYDHIIIDGPPTLGMADALVLANIAEATLLTIRAESTEKNAVLNSLKRLRQAKANVIGTLLNRALMRDTGKNYLHYGQ
ncbi:MAG: polysaccharide biosynthesis tyrosine autokinase [Thiotrichaceae bacterium]|nr:polysaccharide biosynthesis tyrosine autokinase [Thiotrichaceae bacterium]